MLVQNEELRSSKIAILEAQKRELQRVKEGLSMASDMIVAAQLYSPVEQMSTKEALAERVAALNKRFKTLKHVPSESSDGFVTADTCRDTISRKVNVGRVSGGADAASSTCDAGHLPRAVVGVAQTVRVRAKDESGKPCGHGGGRVEAKLILKGSRDPAIHGKTTDHDDGSYSITITAQTAGEHELHVTISNSHIQGSPFQHSVAAPRNTSYNTLQEKQHITCMALSATAAQPYDVAVTEEGHLAVAEYGYHTVTLYKVTGEKIHSFGTANNAGNADGQFNSPSGVAVRGDLLYVSEEKNHRVQKFSIRQQSFLSKFGSKGEGNGQFRSPYGICTDTEGKVFVADYENSRINVFGEDDSFAYSFYCGKKPWGIAFDPKGHLNVVAYSNNTIELFKPEGSLIARYGKNESKALFYPAGIAINAEGYIAISQWWWRGGNLWIYDPDHTLVHTLKNALDSGGAGIACDKEGSFWVADISKKHAGVTKFQ